jgi:hypothetical protein
MCGGTPGSYNIVKISYPFASRMLKVFIEFVLEGVSVFELSLMQSSL